MNFPYPCFLVELPFALQNYHFYALDCPYFTSFHTFTPVCLLLSACLSPKATVPLSRWQSYAKPPSYLGFGLMGSLPSFLFRSFGTVTHIRSVHIPHSSALSSGISHPMVDRSFSGKCRYRFHPCGFHNESGGWNRCFILGPLHSHRNGLVSFGRQIIGILHHDL